MKIESNILLDFNDILIKPKRSDLSSRSEVDLTRTFKFKHSNQTWTGVPIMTSNMTTTGTFEMYEVLSEQKISTVFHKFYNVENFKTFKNNLLEKGKTFDKNFYSLSTGINNDEYQNLKEVIEFLDPMFLTIDVANGYSTKFVEFCKSAIKDGASFVGGCCEINHNHIKALSNEL